MITLSKISYEITDKRLLKNINLTITSSDKIGLIGVNGAGKSTLLKIIAQDIKPSKGQVLVKKGTKVQYLPQEVVQPQNLNISIFEYAKGAFADLYKKEKQLLIINKEIEKTKGENIKLIERQTVLEEELRESGFYEIDSKVRKILIGLGFKKEDFYKPISTLSGGWLMRLELSKIILSNPDIILLDEPINHLDKKSILWLKNFLLSSDIGYIIIAHDQDFLNDVVQEIWELEQGCITKFKGNFDFYIQQKKRLIKRKEKDREKLEKRLKEINQFIERFRAKATKAKQVQSRIKLIKKINLEEIEKKPQINLNFRLPIISRPGKVVLELKNISKSFEKRLLFSNVSFLIKRGQKTALIGPNGVGKSTLLKIISRQLRPESGEVLIGHNVTTAYFAQHQATELPQELSLIEVLKQSSPILSETKLRTILGIFMFKEEDVYKKVSILSGGEKSRLALAKVMAKGANLLLLDEPTNHLDIDAKKALKKALVEFKGSVLIVSHDYNFLDGLIDSILEFKNKSIVFSPLDLKSLSKESFKEINSAPKENLSSNAISDSKGLNKKEKRRLISTIRQEKSKVILPIKNKMQLVEKEIEELEQEKECLEKQLADHSLYTQKQKLLEVNKRYSEVKVQLETLYERWEELSYKFEEKSKVFDQKISNVLER